MFCLHYILVTNYFDSAATTTVDSRVLDEYIRATEAYQANASSVHRLGLEARKAFEDARRRFALALKVKQESMVFTSGATESINIIFSSLLRNPSPGKAIISSAEHDAVSSFIPVLKEKGWEIDIIHPKKGKISAEDLYARLDRNTKIVAIMAVNNILGTVFDIKSLTSVTRRFEKENGKKIFFFSDMVQALGKIDFSLEDLDVDAASFSSHKIHGVKGCGALYLKNSAAFTSLSRGGGQERGLRGGTENIAGVLAFVKAVEIYLKEKEERDERVKRINSIIRDGLEKEGFKILSPEDSSAYIISYVSTWPSEVTIRMLSDKGFYVSGGSACSNNSKASGKKILTEMGIDAREAEKSVRISLSKDNTEEEAYNLINAIKEIRNV